jgi:hypothetical protein
LDPASRTGLYAKSPNELAIRSRQIRRLVERLRRTMPWLGSSVASHASFRLFLPREAIVGRLADQQNLLRCCRTV